MKFLIAILFLITMGCCEDHQISHTYSLEVICKDADDDFSCKPDWEKITVIFNYENDSNSIYFPGTKFKLTLYGKRDSTVIKGIKMYSYKAIGNDGGDENYTYLYWDKGFSISYQYQSDGMTRMAISRMIFFDYKYEELCDHYHLDNGLCDFQ